LSTHPHIIAKLVKGALGHSLSKIASAEGSQLPPYLINGFLVHRTWRCGTRTKFDYDAASHNAVARGGRNTPSLEPGEQQGRHEYKRKKRSPAPGGTINRAGGKVR
jgi:hypothetical protein